MLVPPLSQSLRKEHAAVMHQYNITDRYIYIFLCLVFLFSFPLILYHIMSSSTTTGACALIEETHNGVVFPKLHLKHPSGRSSVDVYLYGANITSFKILGNEMLFMR